MNTVIFEDPPTERPGRGPARIPHAIVAAQLRSNPGRWARIDTAPDASASRSMASNIRGARNLKWYEPAGSFQATARAVDIMGSGGIRRREYRVYAKFVGEV